MPYIIKPRWCVDKFHDTENYENCGFDKDYLNKMSEDQI